MWSQRGLCREEVGGRQGLWAEGEGAAGVQALPGVWLAGAQQAGEGGAGAVLVETPWGRSRWLRDRWARASPGRSRKERGRRRGALRGGGEAAGLCQVEGWASGRGRHAQHSRGVGARRAAA